MRSHLIKKSLLIVLIVFILHLLAYQFRWYETIFGFDKLQHTLGGVFLGLVGGVLLQKYLVLRSTPHTLAAILAVVIIVGMAWEVFEYTVQFLVKTVHLASPADSVVDLLFDAIGGMIGSFFVISAKRRYTVTNGATNSTR